MNNLMTFSTPILELVWASITEDHACPLRWSIETTESEKKRVRARVEEKKSGESSRAEKTVSCTVQDAWHGARRVESL